MVRMVTTCAGPDGVYCAGRVYDMPRKLAEQLLLGGAAGDVPAAEEIEPSQLNQREAAAMSGGQQATLLRGTKRARQ
jgi:hypothetical protein